MANAIPGCFRYPDGRYGPVVLVRDEGIFFASPSGFGDNPVATVDEAAHAIESGLYVHWHGHEIGGCLD